MKKMVILLSAMVAISVAVPALAADEKPQTEKDLCLLYARNCAGRVDSILEKITRLQTEIAKGTKVYTPEELRKLEQKLKESEDLLDIILYSPSRGGSRRR